MMVMNAPTKTINTFLVNIINRAPIPQSMKDAIGDDPLGKLKSVRSVISDPKTVTDELPLPNSVKEVVDSVLPNSASEPESVKSKVTFAPESTSESVVVPVVAAAAAAAVVSKVATQEPAPAPRPAPLASPPPSKPPGVVVDTKPKLVSPAPAPAQQKQNDDKNKKAKIELNAADLAAVQAYLKQKGTNHKVIS